MYMYQKIAVFFIYTSRKNKRLIRRVFETS